MTIRIRLDWLDSGMGTGGCSRHISQVDLSQWSITLGFAKLRPPPRTLFLGVIAKRSLRQSSGTECRFSTLVIISRSLGFGFRMFVR
jgi:hypothetical protein